MFLFTCDSVEIMRDKPGFSFPSFSFFQKYDENYFYQQGYIPNICSAATKLELVVVDYLHHYKMILRSCFKNVQFSDWLVHCPMKKGNLL